MSDAHIPPQLGEVAKKVAEGERSSATVRTLLSWFYGSKRRGRWIVSVIREALDALNLKTEPDFDWTYLDAAVTFLPQEKATPALPAATTPVERGVRAEDAMEQRDAVAVSLAPHFDPTYRIGRLEIARRPPLAVPPDATIQQAVTIMFRNDFSQLPVMVGDRDVKGLFSWRSFGSLCSQKRNCEFVREALEGHCEVNINESVFRVVALIKNHDCVLVRDIDKKIVGIITAYDISSTFEQLAEPFLVLGEIELHIRALVEGKFTSEELVTARDPGDPDRKIEKVSDLTFGEYIRLIENPGRWTKLDLHIDRVMFIKELDEIRRIRNDVMHFDPEGIDDADLKRLHDFVSFLQRLYSLKPGAAAAWHGVPGR